MNPVFDLVIPRVMATNTPNVGNSRPVFETCIYVDGELKLQVWVENPTDFGDALLAQGVLRGDFYSQHAHAFGTSVNAFGALRDSRFEGRSVSDLAVPAPFSLGYGTIYPGDFLKMRPFTGYLDDVLVWQGRMTDAQVIDRASESPVLLPDALNGTLHWYEFNDTWDEPVELYSSVHTSGSFSEGMAGKYVAGGPPTPTDSIPGALGHPTSANYLSKWLNVKNVPTTPDALNGTQAAQFVGGLVVPDQAALRGTGSSILLSPEVTDKDGFGFISPLNYDDNDWLRRSIWLGATSIPNPNVSKRYAERVRGAGFQTDVYWESFPGSTAASFATPMNHDGNGAYDQTIVDNHAYLTADNYVTYDGHSVEFTIATEQELLDDLPYQVVGTPRYPIADRLAMTGYQEQEVDRMFVYAPAYRYTNSYNDSFGTEQAPLQLYMKADGNLYWGQTDYGNWATPRTFYEEQVTTTPINDGQPHHIVFTSTFWYVADYQI